MLIKQRVAAIALGMALVAPRIAQAGILGSAHDLSDASWNTSQQVCVVCHTPHNALSTIAPLWNHRLTETTFTTYTSASMQSTPGQPSASSKVCLSCHDGTVGLNSFGANFGTIYIDPSKSLGTSLLNDHPISMAYDAALAEADGGLHNPTSQVVSSLGSKTIEQGLLINGKVECGSCHDVHKNKGDSPSSQKLLLVNNDQSRLCLTCHKK